MTWKIDPIALSKKLRERIVKDGGEVSYSSLEQRAIELGIALDVLDAALSKLHRFKEVKQKVRGEEIFYQVAKRSEPKLPNSHITWLNRNYPRPEPCEAEGCYGICSACMPFPEIDLSFIFLTPQEMKEYKAAAKGMPMHMIRRYPQKE